MVQIDSIHSASAIGTWAVHKEFKMATLADLLLLLLLLFLLLNLGLEVVAIVFSTGI